MGRRRKPNQQTHPEGEAELQPEAAGAETPAEARPRTGPSIQLECRAHRRAASSARPRRAGFSSENRESARGGCLWGHSRRDAAPPAPHLPAAHPPTGPHGSRGADSGYGGPASHPDPGAAPTPSRAPGASGLVPPHARSRRSPRASAAPSQLWAGRGFRTGRLRAGSREYQPGTAGEESLLPDKEAAAAAAPPAVPSTQAGATPGSTAPRPRAAHSAPLPRRATTLPRPHVRAGAPPGFRLAAQWRVGGEEERGPLPRAWGRKSCTLPSSFVTSWGSDKPFHSARAAHWFCGRASRDCARGQPGEGWGCAAAAGLAAEPVGRKRVGWPLHPHGSGALATGL